MRVEGAWEGEEDVGWKPSECPAAPRRAGQGGQQSLSRNHLVVGPAAQEWTHLVPLPP